MAKSWQELKKELQEETKKLLVAPPDEIKRFHYGLITHSDAGKHALNQYLGHWVHLYSFYFAYTNTILPALLSLARDPRYDLEQLKDLFRLFTPTTATTGPMLKYAGQTTLAKYGDETVAALDTVQTKEEFLELIRAWFPVISRLYKWVHWYFPWGAGPAICPRLSPEDVKEMVRLSQTV